MSGFLKERILTKGSARPEGWAQKRPPHGGGSGAARGSAPGGLPRRGRADASCAVRPRTEVPLRRLRCTFPHAHGIRMETACFPHEGRRP